MKNIVLKMVTAMEKNNIHIVLYNPEIPQNTGNIMRTCVALNMKLHLIKPLGFKIDEKKLRRSAVDYYDKIDYTIYEDFNDFKNKNIGEYYFLTRYGKQTYSSINFKEETKPIYIIFGSESYGIDRSLLYENINKSFRIPTTDNVRSINISNAVSVVAFEAMRQKDFIGLEKFEPETLKGKDYLSNYK